MRVVSGLREVPGRRYRSSKRERGLLIGGITEAVTLVLRLAAGEDTASRDATGGMRDKSRDEKAPRPGSETPACKACLTQSERPIRTRGICAEWNTVLEGERVVSARASDARVGVWALVSG